MKTTKFFTIAALATIAAAASTGAFADQWRDGSAYALKFEGSRARAEVRTEAVEQARNFETRPGDNVAQTVRKGTDRAAVRAEAAQSARLRPIAAG